MGRKVMRSGPMSKGRERFSTCCGVGETQRTAWALRNRHGRSGFARLFHCDLLEEVLGIVELFGIEKAVELADARWVAHLAERLGLDLADAFAGDFELLADFLEGAAITIDQAETERQHAAFAFGERVEHVDNFFAQERKRGHIVGIVR